MSKLNGTHTHIATKTVTVRRRQWDIKIYEHEGAIYYCARTLYNLIGAEMEWDAERFTPATHNGVNIVVVAQDNMQPLTPYLFDADNVPNTIWIKLHLYANDQFRLYRLEKHAGLW